uniref:Glucosylceramidase n=1 Tax=Acrobeloides nanus TaxID=290746 RepID=A0A914DH32_9BILA
MKEYLSLIILYGVIQATISQNPCILKNAADITSNNPAGFVCVCNSTYCDDLPQLNNLQNNNVAIYRSSLSGQRFYTEQYNLTTASANSNDTVITIDSSIKYQQIHGFGGAFTGTASYNIMKLAYGSRINLMNSYFGQTGNGYTTCRVTLAASDFSIKGYSYDDSPGDFNLTNFKLDELEDIAYKIPAIQMAQSFAGNNLKLFGSPWSPPAWMKNNTNISGQADGVIMGSFTGNDSAYWNTYANYFYRDFIKYFLGPKLKANALTRDLKIMIWDFNRNNAENYTDTVLADQAAASYVDGIAIHWYDDVQFKINYTVPEHIHAKHPDKWIMNTEACAGWMGKPDDIKGVTLGNWSRGELYAHDILDNLNHWSTGWVDWNMVLNMTGGPLWQANPVDAPIIVADDNVTFYKQPMFYVLGHFRLFIECTIIYIKYANFYIKCTTVYTQTIFIQFRVFTDDRS